MPLYQYFCKHCETKFDDFNTVERRKHKKCPDCGKKAEHQITTVRIDYYNMGVSDSFPTCVDKWEKMHKKEALREYD